VEFYSGDESEEVCSSHLFLKSHLGMD
jgi:hypothetical protein